MSTANDAALRLPLSFDVGPLVRDVEALGPEDWTRHFNTAYYEGSWSGVPLIGPAGETHPIRQLHPDPSSSESAPTEILGRCPNIAAVLERFECRIRSARLLRLAVGSVIREHTDHNLALEDGELRLHLPIATNPGVTFVVAGSRIDMQPGELWYTNVNLPHRVSNEGERDRVHLVLDCVVDDWVEGLFRTARVASVSR